MSVVDASFDHPMALEERAAMPLAGGIMGNGYQCGMLWGAALSAGAQAYRLHGAGPQAEAEAVRTTQRCVAAFVRRSKHLNCFEITEMNFKDAVKETSKRQMMMLVLKFFLKGGPIACFSISASYARTAFDEIRQADADASLTAIAPPVCCTALLARRMGATNLQAVMAAGFAGGIGLSGGACGALGAAVWMRSMQQGRVNPANIAYSPEWGDELIAKFLESSDYEFECTRIVGRQFESVADHSAYVQNGGCARIIDAMAAAA